MYRHILVTLDGSETSEVVLPEVARVAAGEGVRVTLLTVAEPPQATAGPPQTLVVAGAPAPGGVTRVPGPRVVEDRTQAAARMRHQLGEYLEERGKPLREKGIEVETEVAFGEPVEEILSVARASDADLIMMATHGRTGLAQVVFGSVASRVVGSGVRPVLLVRPVRLNGPAAS